NQSAGTNIMFYYYDFGDGNWSQQENPNHQYILPGTYNARLTIAGASGFSVSDPESIEVQQAFPEKVLRDIILGKVKITEQQKTTLDFNADGMIDAADVVHYLNNQR
ncbi:MAG TPA: PKD domain-containing protein, partial [Candidatus Sumerlaeota bacterium]|nr:PKD domain-containing protein [Candidatus Sumerlaeota bacterium]